MPLRGHKQHLARLKKLAGSGMERRVGAALYAGGQAIQVEAQVSITTGAVSGKGHVASRPGEAPNQDTGVLGNNIETIQTGPLAVQVSSNAPYAADLELGNSKMEPRPYMAPARDKMRPEVERLVTKAVQQAVRASGR